MQSPSIFVLKKTFLLAHKIVLFFNGSIAGISFIFLILVIFNLIIWLQPQTPGDDITEE